MAKKRKPKRKPKPKPRPRSIRIDKLRPLIREAARTGLVEAIEHCRNFWQTDQGYKRYIDSQIALQAEALMTVVRTAVRDELTRVVLPRRRKR